MVRKNGLSEAFLDRLAETLFHALPSVDGDDGNRLYRKVLRLARAEAMSAAADAWDSCCLATRDSVELAATCARQRTFDVLLEQADHRN